MYKQFVFKYFGESVTVKLSEYNKLYEKIQIEKDLDEKEKKKSRAEKCCSYWCCWRDNKRKRINLT